MNRKEEQISFDRKTINGMTIFAEITKQYYDKENGAYRASFSVFGQEKNFDLGSVRFSNGGKTTHIISSKTGGNPSVSIKGDAFGKDAFVSFDVYNPEEKRPYVISAATINPVMGVRVQKIYGY